MTNKELLYIEDLLEHFLDFSKICRKYSTEISDEESKSLLSELFDSYDKQYEDILDILN